MSATSSASVPTRVRRKPPAWLAGLLVIPVLFGWIGSSTTHSHVEKDLSTRTQAAMIRNGLTDVQVKVDGRSVKLRVPADVDAGQAKDVAKDVAGVADVTVEGAK